jgi:hypothetical protein
VQHILSFYGEHCFVRWGLHWTSHQAATRCHSLAVDASADLFVKTHQRQLPPAQELITYSNARDVAVAILWCMPVPEGTIGQQNNHMLHNRQ